MSKQNITNASQLYSGKGRYAPLFGRNGRVGSRIDPLVKLDLGAPIIGDPNGMIETQNLTSAGVFSVDVTVAAALIAAALDGVCDIPRNIVAAWTGTAVITITGTDEYDEPMSEASASGTSLTGKKAFKTINNISVSGDVTALTVGTGDVLGLPLQLEGEYDILALYADITEEKIASVFVAADDSVATTTTGDIRGTVNPDTVLDGSVNFYCWMKVKGTNTKRELVGVTQA